MRWTGQKKQHSLTRFSRPYCVMCSHTKIVIAKYLGQKFFFLTMVDCRWSWLLRLGNNEEVSIFLKSPGAKYRIRVVFIVWVQWEMLNLFTVPPVWDLCSLLLWVEMTSRKTFTMHGDTSLRSKDTWHRTFQGTKETPNI